MTRITDIDPEWITDKVLKRFKSKTAESSNGCIIWTASLNNKGYGRFRLNGHVVAPHRVSVIIHTGKRIPAGLVVDHLCRTPSCLNVEHLEVVSYAENTARGTAPNALSIRARIDRNECARGHDQSVFGISPNGKPVQCRECHRHATLLEAERRKSDPEYKAMRRARMRAYRARQKELALASN